MILGLFRMMRVSFSLPFSAGFAVIVFYLTGGDWTGIQVRLPLAVVSLFFCLAASYVLNDVMDLEADRINRPDSPYIRGLVTRSIAVTAIVVLFALSLIAAAFVQLRFFLGLLVIAANLVLYDVFSKRVGLFKVIWVAALMTSLYPLAFLFAPAHQGPRLLVLFIHPVWLFLTSVGFEMIKDHLHHEGDRMVAPKGIAKFSGRKAFLVSARWLVFGASLILVAPWLLGYCGLVYLAAAVACVLLASSVLFLKPRQSIAIVYIEVFLLTLCSFLDLALSLS